MPNILHLMTHGDREIVMTRLFDAARERVFACWTEPERLKHWLTGPPGWVLAVCEADLRPGGRYHYVWRAGDGGELSMGGVYYEFLAPERIVCTQLHDQDWTGGETVGTLVLTEQDGKTLTTNTLRYATPAARDAALGGGMEQGMGSSCERLDAMLAGAA